MQIFFTADFVTVWTVNVLRVNWNKAFFLEVQQPTQNPQFFIFSYLSMIYKILLVDLACVTNVL